MKDLIDLSISLTPIDLLQMMLRLNEDQKKVFDRICQVLQNKNQILRLYISDESDTRKSFLIELNIGSEYLKKWLPYLLPRVS